MSKFKIAVVLLLFNCVKALAYEFYYESPVTFLKGGVDHGGKDLSYNSFNKPDQLYSNKKFKFITTVNGQISKDTYELIQDVPDPKEGEYESALGKHFGNKYHVNSNASIFLSYKNFVLSPFYMKGRSNVQLNYTVYPEANGYINIDQGFLLAYGKRSGNFSYGINWFNFNRKYENYDVDIISALNKVYKEEDNERLNSLNASFSFYQNHSTGDSSEFYLNLKNFNHPNQDSKYSASNEDLIPISNVGYLRKHKNYNFEVTIVDLFTYYESLISNRVRMGVSTSIDKYHIQSIGAGLMDGGLSFGTTIGYKEFKISFASYEKNLYNFYEKKSRFYSFGINLGF